MTSFEFNGSKFNCEICTSIDDNGKKYIRNLLINGSCFTYGLYDIFDRESIDDFINGKYQSNGIITEISERELAIRFESDKVDIYIYLSMYERERLYKLLLKALDWCAREN